MTKGLYVDLILLTMENRNKVIISNKDSGIMASAGLVNVLETEDRITLMYVSGIRTSILKERIKCYEVKENTINIFVK